MMRIKSSDLSMLLPDQFSVLDMYVICSLSCCSMYSWKCVCTFLMKREIQQEVTLFSCHSAHNVIATPINNPNLIFIDWIMAEVYDSCQQQGQFSPIMSVVQSKVSIYLSWFNMCRVWAVQRWPPWCLSIESLPPVGWNKNCTNTSTSESWRPWHTQIFYWSLGLEMKLHYKEFRTDS